MRMLIAVVCVLLSTACFAQVPEGWFEFTISVPAQGSVVDVSGLSAGPAGATGAVTIEDGRFVDESGQRIRFLGTNLTFDDAFPPKEIAPEIARRMAALGINIVRFHHLDLHHAPRGIWDPAFDDHQHIDAEQLDRLDWLIYHLKREGIYANINLHVSRWLTEADGFPDHHLRPKYDKGVGNFEPRMIELQKQYARDLLTHVNPYTDSAYVEEPCVAMVEITNEDSALRFALGTELHSLPEPYATTLSDLWHAWLREQYADTEALRGAWDEGSQPLGEEMLRDPDFERGAGEWVLETPAPAEGSMEVVEDRERGRVLHAELTQVGEQPWHFQMHQKGHTLEDGRLYTVSFAAKADPPRRVWVNARYDVPDWRMVGLNEPVELDEQWREFSFTFRADEPLPEHTRISFNNENERGEVWYADVSLRPGGTRGLPDGESLEAGTVSLPLSSATNRAREDWLAFVMELERRYTLEMYDFLKDELGVQASIIDTQATYGGAGGLLRESRMDYTDVHAYWEHPRFPGQAWDSRNWYIPNTPMTAALGRDTLTRLSMYRLAGKPYTVSEYNHPAPNDFRAECMPMFAAMGALQDWDGLFQFCYGEHPEDWATDGIDSYFRMAGDPAKLAMFPVAANLFRRGDVERATRVLTLELPRNHVAELVREHGNDATGIWRDLGVEPPTALTHRLQVGWLDGSIPHLQTPPAESTGLLPVRWGPPEDEGATFLVDTEETKVLLGPVAGDTVELGGVRFKVGETSNGYAAIALTSVDGLPLSRSQRMLLVAMNRVENREMGWDEERTTVGREWGHGPVICEGVPLTVSIDGRGDLRAWALKGDGSRGAAVEGLSVGAEYATVWYEVGE
ncbi:MAG: carbohydrate binding domain-containing protein [Armatimonadota bacterium]